MTKALLAFTPLSLLGLLTFAACGGGDDGDDDPQPSFPELEAGAPANDADVQPDAQSPLPGFDGGFDPRGDAALSLPEASLPSDGSLPRPDSGSGVPRPADTGQINFRPCAESRRDCGSMMVPLDYENQEAGALRIAVMRRRASGERLGVLLVNPGGPGASAIDYLGLLADETVSPLFDRFDMVAFDPRGVGYSSPLDCHETVQNLYAFDPSPEDEPEWQVAIQTAARFAEDCRAAHATVLPHLHTRNVARDMDRVRAALGEEKIAYLGFSYGASIGAFYADFFPDRISAMVLDAPVDLELSALDLALEQAKGFERALERYFAFCRAQPTRCAWANGMDPRQALLSLLARVEQTAMAAPKADRPLGPGELLTAVAAPLYAGEPGWIMLSGALAAGVAGDGSALVEFVDRYLQREADGTYPNREEANHAVNCIDRQPMSVSEIRAAAPRFVSEAPLFGFPALTSQLVCAHWAASGTTIPVPRAMNAPPLVVLGTTADPATPYAWAEAFASDLGSAILLTSVGDGHTAYGRGNACIDEAVHAYLFNRVVPTRNACGAPPLARTLGARDLTPRYYAPRGRF